MHMFTNGFYGGNGIVGAQVPLGAGLAFSTSTRTTKLSLLICMVMVRLTKDKFSSYNMAKLWNLPVIFA